MGVLTSKQYKKIDQYFYAVAAGSDLDGWRQPIQCVWKKYNGSIIGEIMIRRYIRKQYRETIQKELHISFDRYFRYSREVIISAALEALRAGLDIYNGQPELEKQYCRNG